MEIETPPASYDFISNEETEGRKRPSLWLPLLSPTVAYMRVGSTFTPLPAGDNWILMWVRNMKSLLGRRRPWRTLAIKHNHGTTELLVHRHVQRGEAAESIFQFRGWNSGLKFTTLSQLFKRSVEQLKLPLNAVLSSPRPPAGGVLLRYLSLLHALHPLLPWGHPSRSHRRDPLLHHARLQ